MSDPITLSIIVPVYNIEAFLPESLDSLAKIKFDDPYEIIVIDDGSSDGSLATAAYPGPVTPAWMPRKGSTSLLSTVMTRWSQVSFRLPSKRWRKTAGIWSRVTPASSKTTSFSAFNPAATAFRTAAWKLKNRKTSWSGSLETVKS